MDGDNPNTKPSGKMPKIKFVRRARTANQPTTAPPAVTHTHEFDISAAINAIGYIHYNTARSTWFSESDRRQTIKEGLSILTTILERNETLTLVITRGTLKVDGKPFEVKDQRADEYILHLVDIGATNVTFTKGLTADELMQFTTLTSRSAAAIEAEGGFLEAVRKAGFTHVMSKKMKILEVTDEDTVVSKAKLAALAEEEKQKVEADVLSLLAGEEGEPGDERNASLAKMVETPEALADLVLQVVNQAEGAAPDKKQVAEVVVDCLDRAFDTLINDPFSKTKKGKKAIARALSRLEPELLSKMQTSMPVDETTLITTAVERMTGRLKMDSVVQDYARKLKALERSEKQILRFMKLQGLDRLNEVGLGDSLNDQGVDVSDWHKLLAKGADGDEQEQAERAVHGLAALLDRLEEDLTTTAPRTPPVAEAAVKEDLESLREHVGVVTERTVQKIEGLVESVVSDIRAVDAMEAEAARAGRGPKLSRRRMIEILAEVVQELSQPLSVVDCTLQMILSDALGEVPPTQKEMIDVAYESTVRIRKMIGNLKRISGFPKSLTPDKDIQDMFNR